MVTLLRTLKCHPRIDYIRAVQTDLLSLVHRHSSVDKVRLKSQAHDIEKVEACCIRKSGEELIYDVISKQQLT